MELMDHQKEAVDNLSNGKILWGGVGSGKSATVLAYYMKRERPRNIYVITTAKKTDSLDWESEAAKFGIGTKFNATVAGVLVVDSWNNVGKYTDIEDAFFIFDEQRVVGYGTWVKAFIKIAKKNHWLLLSATPGDTWLDYVPVFIANNLYRNKTEFLREHVVFAPFSRYPKIVRYTGVETLQKYKQLLLVEMPYVSHMERVDHWIECEYDTLMFKEAVTKRWNPYTKSPMRDVAELWRVMRKIVNSDASRLNAVSTLLKEHDRLIVFYNFDYELELLRALDSNVEVAEWNGHLHQPIPQTERWLYLVQYVAGSEGWNCTTTNKVCFYSLTYSYKNFMQGKGRIDRLDSPYSVAEYFVLFSNSIVDRAIRLSLSGKKTFNEPAWIAENMGLKKDFQKVV